MKFTHLHTHSHYSLLDGLSKIDGLLDRAKELGMDSLALTDHGSMYGAIEFYKKAKVKGIKPILGEEFYVAKERMEQRRPHIDDKKYHLLLLAKNFKGYQNLVKLTTKACLEGFYYKPRIDEELLEKHSEGLICATACLQGKIPQLLIRRRFDEAKKLAQKYQSLFGKDSFYLELQHHPRLKEQKIANDGLISLSKKLDIPLIATNDIHYLRREDAEAQDILMLINTGADLNDSERLTMKGEDFSFRTAEEMAGQFKDVPEAIENTQKIANLCNLEIELGKTKLPHFKLPEGKVCVGFLRELCEAGMRKKGIEKTLEIQKRLDYEISVIEQTGFISYFLIVQDFVNWAKENGIVVGPGRGSAGGSLVSYLLNITDIDPLKYNLLFERFLNPERTAGLPDIDLDFADKRRDEVIDYVSKKYGQDRVARIITFGTMAARQVVRDVGRALGYKYSYCDRLAKMIPFFSTLQESLEKVEEFRQIYRTDQQARKLIDLGKKLEGVARHASTHACGVVISDAPLSDLIPLQFASQDDKTVITQYGMHSIEDMGLLKMDLLGLKNLTIIEDALLLINKFHNLKIDISKLPLDDKGAYRLLQKGDTTGLFQVECLSGETIISNTTIKKLYEEKSKKNLESVYLDEGKVHKNEIVNVVESGQKDVFMLIAENNRYIKATKDHYFLTEDGWKKLEDIKAGNKVLIKNKAKYLVYSTCRVCGKQISGQEQGKSKFCYKCSASFYRNPCRKESREKIKAGRLKFFQQGGKPWNYGVTTENNEIWRKTAEKISKALAGRTLEELWGKEKAENFKKAHSERNKGENNPMFGKPSPHRKGGFRADLGHYVRSTWEADFARILKFYNLDYQYEPKIFELIKPNGKTIHYTPDFYIPSKNTFYEIKGWMHELDKEKIELFQKRYPQYNLTIISATKFAELSLKYKKLINWECPRLPIKQSFKFIKVKNIKYCGKEITYDIVMKSPGNNFVANSFLAHNSEGMKRYLKELKPTQFEDIIAMVALYRPGPMELIPEYIQRKHRLKRIEYLHPKLEPILKDTYGVMIFQEQLMEVAQSLAGFSMGEADFLRKAVGKKIKELLLQQRKKMISGMIKNGIDKKTAQKIWDWILPFVRYGFNRSHGAAYALITYQTAYLKAHFPLEFMTVLMNSEQKNIDKLKVLLEEAKKMEIDVLPPDINESKARFTIVDKNKIRFGLTAIKNVGANVVEKIITERERKELFTSIEDFAERMPPEILNKKSIESLIKSGAFDKFGDRGKLLFNLEKILEFGRSLQRNKLSHDGSLFSLFKKKNEYKAGNIRLEEPVNPPTEDEKIFWEKELLGVFVSSHPLNKTKGKIKNIIPISALNHVFVGQRIKVAGIVSGIKKVITRSGGAMLFLEIEDESSRIETLIFPDILERNLLLFQENKVLEIKGRLSDRGGELKIICEGVMEIK